MARTAAVLIIGNEILSGKIQDQNLRYLASELFALGIRLERAIVCPDVVDVIVRDVNALRQAYDLVFTSGGVGPTHDDLTLPAIAAAFGRPLQRAEPIASQIRGYYKARCTEEHLRMADVPEGSLLLESPEVPWPTVVVENVYIFPGVPEIFRFKFPVVREHLRGDERLFSRAVYTHCEEGAIAGRLAELAAAHPQVAIGSYPRFRDPDHRLKVTFDGSDAEAVDAALQAFVAGLAEAMLVRIE